MAERGSQSYSRIKENATVVTLNGCPVVVVVWCAAPCHSKIWHLIILMADSAKVKSPYPCKLNELGKEPPNGLGQPDNCWHRLLLDQSNVNFILRFVRFGALIRGP